VWGAGIKRWCPPLRQERSVIEARRGRDLQELDAQHESPAGLRLATPHSRSLDPQELELDCS
jgi:hypothetical protein